MAVWQEKRLGEVAEVNPEHIINKLNYNIIKYIDISSVKKGILYGYNTYAINNAPDRAKRIIRKNDIIISTVRPNLKAYYFIKKNIHNLICSTGFAVIRAKNNINPYFLYYITTNDSFINYLSLIAKGSTYPAVDKKDFIDAKILIPDLATQEKIADILSTYDDLIENNNRRIEILEQMAQEIYKEWFVRFRFPEHEKVKFKSIKMKNWILSNNSISSIPNIWNIGYVNELASFKRGTNLTSANMISGNIPVISAGIQLSGYHINANVFGQSITISASGANAGYLLYHLNDIWASDCSYLQSEYIWFIYNTLKFLQPVLSNLQCGVAQPHVYPKQINKIPIIIPTNEILIQYCSKVEPIYKYIKNLKENNQNLIKQRDLLLPRLMSGKLEV